MYGELELKFQAAAPPFKIFWLWLQPSKIAWVPASLPCAHLFHWPCRQRCLVNCDWIHASYTLRQSPYPCRHPTCWASSQRSHTVSSMMCHRAFASAPLSAHLLTVWERTAFQILTPICIWHTTTPRLIWWQQQKCGAGCITTGMQSGWRRLRDSVLSSLTSKPTPLDWPCQEQRLSRFPLLIQMVYSSFCGL